MWGDEAHLPAWPSGPASGVTARTFRAAWRAVRRYTTVEPATFAYNAWVGGTPNQQRSVLFR